MAAGMHLDPARWGEQKRRANRARYRAMVRLKARHAAEWDELYAEECRSEDVTPRPEMQRHVRGQDGRGSRHG
jgi:hypothetical protein